MKLNFKQILIACSALMVGLTSCNNNGNDTNVTKEGAETSVELSVSFPKTKASNDNNATDSEVALNNVTVFIFNADGIFLKKATLSSSDFDAMTAGTGDNDKYVAKTKIATTTGVKKIYVGVNLPSDFPTVTKIQDLMTAWSFANLRETGMPMFSVVEHSANLVVETDATYNTVNKMTINVQRMVAKVAVQKGATFMVEDGAVKNLKYSLRKINTKMFPMQQKSGAVVIDPNYTDAQYNAADFVSTDIYVGVNESTVAVRDLVVKYAPENTSEKKRYKETTFASITAEFIPSSYSDGAGLSKGVNTETAAKTFWTVTTVGGVKLYFDVQTEADAYQMANVGSKLKKYTNGITNYSVYLYPDRSWGSIRNDFYHITIDKIKGPGATGPDPEEPIDPEDPIETDTSIFVSLEVVAWTYYAKGFVLQ